MCLICVKQRSMAINKTAKKNTETLQEYIITENNRGKNLFGVIVVPVGEGETSWNINSSDIYSDDLKDLSQWRNFLL